GQRRSLLGAEPRAARSNAMRREAVEVVRGVAPEAAAGAVLGRGCDGEGLEGAPSRLMALGREADRGRGRGPAASRFGATSMGTFPPPPLVRFAAQALEGRGRSVPSGL